jgi:NADPH2:quinone reductase
VRALLSYTATGPDSLKIGEVADPIAKEDEVVIRIFACGLNYPDLLLVRDKYQDKPPRPFIPGSEVAGEIIAVGAAVNEFAVGDRAMAFIGMGGLAEQVAVSASKCIRIPDSMPFDVASAFLTTFGTSYYALKQRGHIRAGETLLVLGASGGVGLAAVTIGHAMGARVIAAASSEAKLNIARQYGASDGVVYPAALESSGVKALSDAFKRAVGSEGVDTVYDAVGGLYTEAALRVMAWGGRLLIVGFPAGIPNVALNMTLLKGCEIAGVWYGKFTERESAANAENNRELFDLYEAGKIAPYISARLTLAEAHNGFQLLESREAQGKIVVTIC